LFEAFLLSGVFSVLLGDDGILNEVWCNLVAILMRGEETKVSSLENKAAPAQSSDLVLPAVLEATPEQLPKTQEAHYIITF